MSRDAIQHSVAAIVERHEVFRTSFAVYNGEPVQVVHSFVPFALEFIDLSGSTHPELELRTIADNEANNPFNLA
ncbi:MAG: hypothetical protein NVS9B15_17730 [Acidobacteriaceae bacterium]